MATVLKITGCWMMHLLLVGSSDYGAICELSQSMAVTCCMDQYMYMYWSPCTCCTGRVRLYRHAHTPRGVEEVTHRMRRPA